MRVLSDAPLGIDLDNLVFRNSRTDFSPELRFRVLAGQIQVQFSLMILIGDCAINRLKDSSGNAAWMASVERGLLELVDYRF
jgi:hypothetical protein